MTYTIFRPKPPALGIASTAVGDQGLGAHPSVLFFMDCSSGRVADYVEMAAPDYTSGSSYDWTGRDRSKLPWVQGKKLAWGGGGPDVRAPAIVDNRFTEFGFAPLTPTSKAMMFSCGVGQELVVDLLRFFIPTATGDQKLAFDPHGKLPQEMYVRWYQLIGSDMVVPSGSKRNGGKSGSGFAHRTSMCGNGGAFCHKSAGVPESHAGRIGSTSRGQFELPNTPSDPSYGRLLWGTYQYNAVESQNAYMFGLAAHLPRAAWRCCERMNTIDPSGVVAAKYDGIIRAWVDGIQVFEKDDFKWRDNRHRYTNPNKAGVVADAGILSMWWNSFFGGQYGGAPIGQPSFRHQSGDLDRVCRPMRGA